MIRNIVLPPRAENKQTSVKLTISFFNKFNLKWESQILPPEGGERLIFGLPSFEWPVIMICFLILIKLIPKFQIYDGEYTMIRVVLKIFSKYLDYLCYHQIRLLYSSKYSSVSIFSLWRCSFPTSSLLGYLWCLRLSIRRVSAHQPPELNFFLNQ